MTHSNVDSLPPRQEPDSFERSEQLSQELGEPAQLPNRAQSEGAFEASGRCEGGVCERSGPARDEMDEQAIDESVELTFPASDPAAAAGPGHITRVEVELDEQGQKIDP